MLLQEAIITFSSSDRIDFNMFVLIITIIFKSDIYCKNLIYVFFLNMIHETTTGSNPPQAPPNPSNPNVPGSILIREMGRGIRA